MGEECLLAQRAAAGAKYLDEIRPGWFAGVNIAVLNMSSCFDCVLGQLHGGSGYFDSSITQSGSAGWRQRLGFEIAPPDDYDQYRSPDYVDVSIDARYLELTEAWREEIDKRRKADQCSDSGSG